MHTFIHSYIQAYYRHKQTRPGPCWPGMYMPNINTKIVYTANTQTDFMRNEATK